MTATLDSPTEVDAPSMPAECAIKILILYDDERTRDRVLRTRSHLLRELGVSFNFRFSWFRFKSLWHPRMMALSVDAGAGADVVILSVLRGKDLPQIAKKWLETWRPKRDPRRLAVLALLETASAPSARPSLVDTYLRRIAANSKMDFLSYADEIPPEPHPLAITEGATRAPETHRASLGVFRNAARPESRSSMLDGRPQESGVPRCE